MNFDARCGSSSRCSTAQERDFSKACGYARKTWTSNDAPIVVRRQGQHKGRVTMLLEYLLGPLRDQCSKARKLTHVLSLGGRGVRSPLDAL